MRVLTRSEWEVWNILRKRDISAANVYMKRVCHRHRLSAAPERKDRIVCCWGESYISKEFFPFHFTEDEKEEFINENWILPPFSEYDCTGKMFTSGISVFNLVDGRSVVYYHMTADV